MLLILLIHVKAFVIVETESQNRSCKDMLQGYLTGQLTSALGHYQVEALKREFKSFTDVIKKAIKVFPEKVGVDLMKPVGKLFINTIRFGHSWTILIFKRKEFCVKI